MYCKIWSFFSGTIPPTYLLFFTAPSSELNAESPPSSRQKLGIWQGFAGILWVYCRVPASLSEVPVCACPCGKFCEPLKPITAMYPEIPGVFPRVPGGNWRVLAGTSDFKQLDDHVPGVSPACSREYLAGTGGNWRGFHTSNNLTIVFPAYPWCVPGSTRQELAGTGGDFILQTTRQSYSRCVPASTQQELAGTGGDFILQTTRWSCSQHIPGVFPRVPGENWRELAGISYFEQLDNHIPGVYLACSHQYPAGTGKN